ncbi:MAG: hypothetical protein LBQ83_06650 [Candidatus Margulisbacteria bacterium]|jgi:hypothetical protein|nr:hypothetical protein [Candidatus Margulisiibacteriota bacterium]
MAITRGDPIKAEDINNAFATKQDKIAAGTAHNIMAYSGTAGTLNTLDRVTGVRAAATALDTAIPTEKAVATALAAKANSSEMTTALAAKANSSEMTAALDTKANASDMAIALAAKANASDVQAKLPMGTILMYDGSGWQDNVTLVGWYQCNGQNNTPDLRDRFIKCKGSVPDKGGSNSLTAAMLPAHTHSLKGVVTTGMSANSSGTIYKEDIAGDIVAGGVLFSGRITNTDGCISVPSSTSKQVLGYTRGGGPLYVGQIKIDVEHTHSFADDASTGNNSSTVDSYNNMPSYYSVIYIKKLA